MNKKNRALGLVLGVFALVIATTAASFAFFQYSRTGTTNTTVVSGDIQFSFVDTNTVTIANAFPLSDTIGASDNTYVYDFNVDLASTSNKVSAKYDVTFLTDNTGTNNFNNDQIKFNLMKNDAYIIGNNTTGVLLSTVTGFDTGKSNGAGVVVSQQTITAGQTDSYKLRIWISDDVNYSGDIDSNGTMTGKYNANTYTLRVKVDASASYQQ